MSTPTIKPRGKSVLVKPDEPQSKTTETGLYRPDNVEEEEKAYGEVVAVGPEQTDVVIGKRVLFGAFAGDKLNFSDDPKHVDFVILQDEDVLAFIENPE